jgi:ABC-2 type transport system permease protein/sodium transport system permease protein
VLAGHVDPTGAMAAIVSTIAYAGAALMIAARIFGSDAVSRTSQQSIGSLLVRPRQSSPTPSPQAASLMLALLVPIYFLIANGLMRFLEQARDQIDVVAQLSLNAAALIAAFGLIPLVAAIAERNRLLTTYQIVMPPLRSLFGAVLIGLGAWAFAHELFVIAAQLGIGGLEVEKIEAAQRSIDKLRTVSPLLLLAVFAVVPAVIEELCFRGYLFSSLRTVMTPVRTVVITAVLFGVFHVLTGNALLIERFLPSTLMGLIIGSVAYQSGSVIPGMVIHFVHNGLLMMVLYYQQHLSFLGPGFDHQQHLPGSWILIATLLLALGMLGQRRAARA